MAIISPADLPVVVKVHSNGMKAYVLSKLGHPNVSIEIQEPQFEQIWSVVGDMFAGFWPREQRLAVFWTQPLKSTYPLPSDAYWVQEINWDPVANLANDVFGAENFLFNAGNVASSSNMLLDFHLLHSYRKWTQRVLATEGKWEVINEVNGDTTRQLIRLYPTPKGSFPVVVVYLPVVTHFRSPQAKYIAYEIMVAQAKIMLGHARRKIAGMPGPDGGAITYDGAELVTEGETAMEKWMEQARLLGEPDGVFFL